MIEIRIWTHIGQLTIRVDSRVLAQMQIDAKAKAVGEYRVLWCTDEERTLVINWSNVIILDCPAHQSTASSLSY